MPPFIANAMLINKTKHKLTNVSYWKKVEPEERAGKEVTVSTS